ncbi:amidohydrolase family protein [Nonomuraea helvata]|uniref:Amidohydrolase family protein n=1 Tax=Nonomuraea helvata TaxID=37484 RepID=A0ABV5SLK6_9ACTN
MTHRILVRGGHVVSMDDAVGDRPGCDILIEDDLIAAVEPGLDPAGADEVIDARDTVVLPGFVDTHRHLWMTVLRGTQADETLGGYQQTVQGSLPFAVQPQDVYAGTLLGAWEALNAGITTVLDYAHLNPTLEHAEAGIRALRETGIRALYAHGSVFGVRRPWGSPEQAEYVRELLRPRQDDRLLTFGIAFGAPYGESDWALAAELDVPATLHACVRSAGAWPASHTIEELNARGLLRAGTVYSHCTIATDAELKLIADSGGHVSVSPYVEMVMGHGRPVIARALAQGLLPSLGADVVSSGPGDMFSQMRAAFSQARAETVPDDPDAPYRPGLTARDVLRFATAGGAAACGLGDITGSLTPGKRADLVTVRTDQINTMPAGDPVGVVVANADVSTVDTVLVGGVARKRDGRLLADLPGLRDLARDAAARLHRHAGNSVAAHPGKG